MRFIQWLFLLLYLSGVLGNPSLWSFSSNVYMTCLVRVWQFIKLFLSITVVFMCYFMFWILKHSICKHILLMLIVVWRLIELSKSLHHVCMSPHLILCKSIVAQITPLVQWPLCVGPQLELKESRSLSF